MKTSEAIQKADGLGNLAEIFGITKSAICQWPEDLPLPRLYELKVKRPDWFDAAGNPLPTDPARPAEAARS